MRFFKLTCIIIFSLFTIVYALQYIESSVGLETPEFEAGRTEIEMADINNDGNIDILSIGDHGSPYVNTLEGNVMVWFGDGNGNWSAYVTSDTSLGYGGIAIGDLNNDGLMDIGYGMHHNWAGNDFGDSILEAALGDGTGQNWIPWDDGISTGGGDWGMFCTDLADINNDGYLDLGSNSFGSDDGIHIFINHGDGTWHQCFGFIGGNSTMDFRFGDVDADGCADFVAAHQYGSIYLGDGQGNFSLADGNLPPGGSLGRSGPSLGDVDNDGDLDFAFCNSNGGIEVWAWQGGNVWGDVSGILPDSGPFSGTQLYDMNIDGSIDVAAFGDSTVTVWSGDGAGNWTHETTFNTPGPGDFSAFRVGGDADHNGYPDMALVGEEGDSWNPINHLRFFKETSAVGSLFVYPIYPRGGETFFAGSVHYVDWTCGVPSGATATIKLELSTSGPSGPWSEIVASTPNNCRYQWSIPISVYSNNCYIRYSASTVTDTSMATTPSSFRILPAPHVAEYQPSSITYPDIDVIPTVSAQNVLVKVSTYGLDKARVRIFDDCGRLVRELFTATGGGEFRICWDRKDNQRKSVPSGIYFITLETDNSQLSKKIVVIK